MLHFHRRSGGWLRVSRIAVVVVVVMLMLSVVAGANAAPVLWIDDSTGTLGKVDVGTGAVTVVGSTGQNLGDIAFDPAGKLYGLDLNHLYTIDTNTAATTTVGSTFPLGGNALAFSPTGTLYAAGANKFAKIDPTTGAATILGNIGPGLSSGGDLAFVGGNLYLSGFNDHLLRINPATGAGTDVGAFGAGVNGIFGLATVDDMLYGFSGTKIYTIDPTTGAASFVMDYGGRGLADAFGAAFQGEAGFNVGGGGATVPLPQGAGAGLVTVAFVWGAARKIQNQKPAARRNSEI
jgi:hypothetical protein